MTRKKKKTKKPSPKEQHRRKMQRRKDKPPIFDRIDRGGLTPPPDEKIQGFTVSAEDMARTVKFDGNDPEESDES